MAAKRTELDKPEQTEFRLEKVVLSIRGQRLWSNLLVIMASGVSGWMGVVKFIRGITCCNASKRRLLQVLHSRDLVPP